MIEYEPVRLPHFMAKDKLLWVYCCDCGHERDVSPATVPLPAKTPVPEVGKHMKCSVCGSRKINTKPELSWRCPMREKRSPVNRQSHSAAVKRQILCAPAAINCCYSATHVN